MARPAMVIPLLLVVLAAGCCAPVCAVAYLSKLPITLDVTASPAPGQVLHGGDVITVVWSLNATRGVDAEYKDVEVKLCYAPVSQKGQEWRKSNDNLDKDKICPFKITKQAYGGTGKFAYRVAPDIPTATYNVRAYALDASGTSVAYGQTAPNSAFNIVGINGVSTSIKVVASVFSTLSIASPTFFFFFFF